MDRTWTPTPRPARRAATAITRSTVELAVVASLVAVAAAYTLHRFAGIGDAPIVLATLVVASVLGWTQPAVRAPRRRAERLAPVVVLDRYRR